MSTHLVVCRIFVIFVFLITSSVGVQCRNVFIRFIFNIYLQLPHMYVQSIAYKSMFHFMAQASYKYNSFSVQSVILSLLFIVVFFLQSYWPF